MSRFRRVLASIAILVACVAVALVVAVMRDPTLEDWAADVARPGYRLLLKKDAHSHYLAIFDAGESQIAICAKDLNPGDAYRITTYAIYDLEGNDLIDLSLPDRNQELYREIRTPFFTYVPPANGIMYPVSPDHTGPFRVIIEGETRVILDKILPWKRL